MKILDIDNPETNEIIIGQGNFTVFTVDDLAKTLEEAKPGIEFGIAMNEAKPKLVRVAGNSEKLKERAAKTALKIGSGHLFVIYMKNAFPIDVLKAIKAHPCVVNVYAATSNPLQVLVEETNLGKSVVGVVDGSSATKIENEKEKKERQELVKKLGY